MAPPLLIDWIRQCSATIFESASSGVADLPALPNSSEFISADFKALFYHFEMVQINKKICGWAASKVDWSGNNLDP